ncbi:MAG: ATP-dependent RNA helicase RhlE [Sulfurimonas sp.]|jgi:ATP-dependent RNA helicase RhlE|uniref:DEAD/DEAH box helicase n=1 Tax=Sulfurimonas sp. TaxID=2022749 RepID=UPI0039E22FE0
MSFKNLGLCDQLLRAVKEQGYDEPTPIQAESIPVILDKRDILAGAQTGTGKTAGFTLPMLELLQRHKQKTGKQHIRALILTPTRELASQVQESVALYGKFLPFKSCVIFGGVKINPQITALRKGMDIVVATPGRLLDHVSQKTIDLSKVDFLILDEADRMLDMGFVNDIRKVIAVLPKQRQTLLFSATYSKDIKKLADTLLNSPILIEVARTNQSAEQINQVIHPVDKTRKRDLLTHLIKKEDWQQVLVFMRTKHGANRLSGQLESDGISSAAIHGNKSQNARTKALADFKAGKVKVLVATDIAARGIDIDQLPHVVNYELPNVPEDYVHRIGRTGRAGNKGEAMSLVCVDEHEFLESIEKLIKKDIHKFTVKGFEPDPSIKAEPISLGGGGGRGRGGNRGGGNRSGNNKPRNGGGGARGGNSSRGRR